MEVVLAPDMLPPLSKLLRQLTCLVVTGGVQIGGGVGVGVADAGRRVQEQHVRHCNPTNQSPPWQTKPQIKAGHCAAHRKQKCIGIGPLFQG